MSDTRICSRCGVDKPLDAYAKSHRAYCTDCKHSKHTLKWLRRHIEQVEPEHTVTYSRSLARWTQRLGKGVYMTGGRK